MVTIPLTISNLQGRDLDDAGALLDAAFGRTGMVMGLHLAYALQPESWLCARRGGQMLAVVGAHDYGPLASIGMMAVHPSEQRQGVGERLLAELVAHLDGRGCPLLFLDASTAGQRLYPKLGFVTEGETLRMRYTTPFREAAPLRPDLAQALAGDGGSQEVTVSRLEQDDLAQVAAFDAPIFGADRTTVISSFWSGSRGRAFVARDRDQRVTGYVLSSANHIGPWVSATPETAAALLSGVFTLPFSSPPFLTCPADNTAAMALLAGHGFAVTEHLLHMRRGAAGDPRQVRHLYSQASLTLG